MPTKTERILSYLPRTLRSADRLSALRSVTNSPGDELQKGENALAGIMRAHWVNTADVSAESIFDLAMIGAMYGLAPQCEAPAAEFKQRYEKVIGDLATGGVPVTVLAPDSSETVEQFREHLKRFVRTQLDGTVTVEGILRMVADSLGVQAAVDSKSRDSWWTRKSDSLEIRETRGDDAAAALFGRHRSNVGAAAQPARVTGTVPLADGVDLTGHSTIALTVDHTTFAVDLAQGTSPANVTLDQMRDRINEKFQANIASHDGRFLTLTSTRVGPEATLRLGSHAEDAVPFVLGLAPHQYNGRNARPARVESPDLSAGVDLTRDRYLRVVLDDAGTHEIDVGGGPMPLDQIKDRINQAIGGPPIARREGNRLVLESRTRNGQGRLLVQPPAAQNAAARIFGVEMAFRTGDDDRPAVFKAAAATAAFDLRGSNNLRLRLDNRPPVTIDCAGQDPAKTQIKEIVTKLNEALGPDTAVHDGAFITLTSATAGHGGQIAVETAEENDGKSSILGLPERDFFGTSALPATLASRLLVREHPDDPFEPVDLLARRWLQIAIDGAAPVLVDLRQAGNDRPAPEDLARTINQTLGHDVASTDASRLLRLTSPTVGPASRVEVVPFEAIQHDRFVTRAMLLGDAAEAVLGAPRLAAQGDGRTRARVVGSVDLREGVDLREEKWIHLAVDGRKPVVVAVGAASVRSRTTTLDELRSLFSHALGDDRYAQTDGKHLVVVSRLEGKASRIEFLPVREEDAIPALFGADPGEARGSDARRVIFVSTVDLSQGVELPPDARVRIKLDGKLPKEIVLNSGTVKVRRQLMEIATLLNGGLEAVVAFREGQTVALRSLIAGPESRLEFQVPAGGIDATKLVFGIEPLRIYQGEPALPAEIRGHIDLSAGIEIVRRYLLISTEGAAAKKIELPLKKMTLAEVVAAINDQFGRAIATAENGQLVLKAANGGSGSRVQLHPYVSRDARERLFGPQRSSLFEGTDDQPATLVGTVDLLNPVDLRGKTKLLIAVDGRRPEEIDIGGELPQATRLAEMIERINAVLPGLASATVNDRLQLRSPSAGPSSQVAVLPRRFIDLLEYTTTEVEQDLGPVKHGHRFTIRNEGAGHEPPRVEVRSRRGVAGFSLVNDHQRVRIRVDAALSPGESAWLSVGPTGELEAEIAGTNETKRPASVVVTALEPGTETIPLHLPTGPSEWHYLECRGDRFDHAHFDAARFAGFSCEEYGVFDVSRFRHHDRPIFAGVEPAPNVEITFRWTVHKAGSFTVRLPAELPARFGGRFNEARLAIAPGAPIRFRGTVTSPRNDPQYLRTMIEQSGAPLTVDDDEGAVRIGFTAARLPFRQPRFLTGGDSKNPARLYLTEEGLDHVIVLQANSPGEWGNQISFAARIDGPGRYDVTIEFAGARFESARALVLGPPLSPLASDLLKPGPQGVLQGKAAGIHARVIRQNTPETETN